MPVFQSPHWRRGVLSLYRSILVTHRRVLNAEQRALGDRVVREEFHAHKSTDEGKASEFLRSWVHYIQVLHGGKLPPLFSDSQLKQLAELRSRIVKNTKEPSDSK